MDGRTNEVIEEKFSYNKTENNIYNNKILIINTIILSLL